MEVFKDAFVYLLEKLIPGIFMHWKKYQKGLIEKWKHHGDIVVAVDGRHDSMSHIAKYCAYTVFCCKMPFIIHFAIVQVYSSHFPVIPIILLQLQ